MASHREQVTCKYPYYTKDLYLEDVNKIYESVRHRQLSQSNDWFKKKKKTGSGL